MEPFRANNIQYYIDRKNIYLTRITSYLSLIRMSNRIKYADGFSF